jgi:hypothetical protein
LHRCLVCEGPIKRKREDQKVCRKAKCRKNGAIDPNRASRKGPFLVQVTYINATLHDYRALCRHAVS